MSYLKNLEWRFATKKFDTNKDLDQKSLAKILKAIRLAPSSYGLQPWHVVVVKNPQLRAEMSLASFSQPQVTEASYLLVFCSRTDIVKRIDDYMELASGGERTRQTELEPMKQSMKMSTGKKSPSELLEWSRRQAYLALGFGLAAAAELKIDACPMEGLETGKIDTILELPEHIKSVAYLALGYRREESSQSKVRFTNDDLFTWKK